MPLNHKKACIEFVARNLTQVSSDRVSCAKSMINITERAIDTFSEEQGLTVFVEDWYPELINFTNLCKCFTRYSKHDGKLCANVFFTGLKWYLVFLLYERHPLAENIEAFLRKLCSIQGTKGSLRFWVNKIFAGDRKDTDELKVEGSVKNYVAEITTNGVTLTETLPNVQPLVPGDAELSKLSESVERLEKYVQLQEKRASLQKRLVACSKV